jgi:hypothetical protein
LLRVFLVYGQKFVEISGSVVNAPVVMMAIRVVLPAERPSAIRPVGRHVIAVEGNVALGSERWYCLLDASVLRCPPQLRDRVKVR